MICEIRTYFCTIEYLKIIMSFIEPKQYPSEVAKMGAMQNVNSIMCMYMCFCPAVQGEPVI